MIEAYIAEAKEAGVDGLLVLDLPPEEAADYGSLSEDRNEDNIPSGSNDTRRASGIHRSKRYGIHLLRI